jgi:hypothetical protein
LVGRPEGKKPLRRLGRVWEDNIRIDRGEIGLEFLDWIYLARGRDQLWVFVNRAMNLQVSQNAGNFLAS